MKHDVEVLASDSFGGRPPASIYEEHTLKYLQHQFSKFSTITSTSPFSSNLNNDSVITSFNIFASIYNNADSFIVITAHYDHLGIGNNKSLEIRRKGIHHGADDNASGVAMMLELGRQLKLDTSKRYNYIFIALGAHEIGLYGSKAVVENKTFEGKRIKLLINLDMVGRLDAVENRIRLSYCSNDLKSLFNPTDSLNISYDSEGLVENDYNVFCRDNIPAVNITTGIHGDYHRISDTADKINYTGMVRVLEYLKKVIE